MVSPSVFLASHLYKPGTRYDKIYRSSFQGPKALNLSLPCAPFCYNQSSHAKIPREIGVEDFKNMKAYTKYSSTRCGYMHHVQNMQISQARSGDSCLGSPNPAGQ